MVTKVALITFLDGSGNYPDNSLPLPGFPGRPDNSLPQPPVDPGFGVRPPVDPGYGRPGVSPGHPSHPIYNPGGPNYPSQGLPVYPSQGPVFPPVGPDNTLPPSGPPPTISLPIYLPPQINPAPPGHTQKFELKYSPVYGWILVPVSEGEIDNTLPPTAEPK